MKGLTKPNLDTITRGHITELKANQIMAEYGTIAFYLNYVGCKEKG